MHRPRGLLSLRDNSAPMSRLHDLHGTFATKLITDEDICLLVGWSERQVSEIRRVFVDDAAVIVALGKSLANVDVKHQVGDWRKAL